MEAKGRLLAAAVLLLGLFVCKCSFAAECVQMPSNCYAAEYRSACADKVLPERTGMNYSVSPGIAVMIADNLRTETAFTLAMDWYGPAGEPFSPNGCVGLSGEWVQVEKFDGRTVDLAPVLVNYRQYWKWGCSWLFMTMGAGMIVADNPVPEMRFSSGINFGWTGGFGINFSDHLYGQVRFIGGENPNLDGWVTASIGYRW